MVLNDSHEVIQLYMYYFIRDRMWSKNALVHDKEIKIFKNKNALKLWRTPKSVNCACSDLVLDYFYFINIITTYLFKENIDAFKVDNPYKAFHILLLII